MKTRLLLRWALAVLLLGLGALTAYLLAPEHGQRPLDVRTVWATRPGDLVIQLGLIFAGALGIRALLPAEAEED